MNQTYAMLLRVTAALNASEALLASHLAAGREYAAAHREGMVARLNRAHGYLHYRIARAAASSNREA